MRQSGNNVSALSHDLRQTCCGQRIEVSAEHAQAVQRRGARQELYLKPQVALTRNEEVARRLDA